MIKLKQLKLANAVFVGRESEDFFKPDKPYEMWLVNNMIIKIVPTRPLDNDPDFAAYTTLMNTVYFIPDEAGVFEGSEKKKVAATEEVETKTKKGKAA